MTVKECGHHDEEEGSQLIRMIIAGVFAFVVLVLFIVFLIWIILRPSKPSFFLQDATVYVFNVSSTSPLISPTTPLPNTVTTTMQVTLSSHNPNGRIGIYYKADVFVSYRGQQITLATELPSTYQGHKDVNIWSPFLYGNTVPVSPYVLSSLQQDLNAGGVMVNVKVSGRVKWKVGTWVSGRYHLNVNCPAYIKFANDHTNGIGFAGPALKFQLLQACSVDV